MKFKRLSCMALLAFVAIQARAETQVERQGEAQGGTRGESRGDAKVEPRAQPTGPARVEEKPELYAHWEPDGYMYPGTIEKEEKGMSFIRFADGDTAWVHPWGWGAYELKVGDEVFGNLKGKGFYFRGKIARREGRFIRIHYDGGDVEDTTIDRIRMKLFKLKKDVGMPVMGRWVPDGYWYPGVILEIREGKYLIKYEDGDKAWNDETQILGYRPTSEDRIEGNWAGRGLFYRGHLVKREGDRVFIHYDDGDEEWTTMSRIRVDYGPMAPETVR